MYLAWMLLWLCGSTAIRETTALCTTNSTSPMACPCCRESRSDLCTTNSTTPMACPCCRESGSDFCITNSTSPMACPCCRESGSDLCIASSTSPCCRESGSDFCTTNSTASRPFLFEETNMTGLLDAVSNVEIEVLHISIFRHINLAEPLVFTNKTTVSITGMEDTKIEIRCWNENSGIKFIDVTQVTLKSINIRNCNIEHGVMSQNLAVFKSSVVVEGSSTVLVQNLVVAGSKNIVLSIVNSSNGSTTIIDSVFEDNIAEDIIKGDERGGGGGGGGGGSGGGGGGLYIDYSTNVSNATIKIENCTFTNNNAGYIDQGGSYPEETESRSGGGLRVTFRGQDYINLSIVDCLFEKNRGVWGGGGSIHIINKSESIVVHINNSKFEGNLAVHGGGLSVSYYRLQNVQNELILFNCSFLNNTAKNDGGGTSLKIDMEMLCNKEIENTIQSVSCTCVENRAIFGAAIYLSPYFSPDTEIRNNIVMPSFQDCRFERNMALRSYQNCQWGSGTVKSSEIDISFGGETVFESNTGSAVYLISSMIAFKKGSQVKFSGNCGFWGGAIALYAASTIHVNDNTKIVFANNSARKGGAIFQSTFYQPAYSTPKTCFLQYDGEKNISERNVSLSFFNNNTPTSTSGRAIFVSSLLQCHQKRNEPSDHLLIINSIAYFNFSGGDEGDYGISTFGHNFTIRNPDIFIPGKITEIDIESYDDTNSNISAVYKISVVPLNGSDISLDEAFTYVSNKKIRILGKPGGRGEMKINLQDIYLVKKFNITLQECPPGYIHSEDEKICECSANHYPGIRHCNLSNFRANLLNGFWAGYITEDENGTQSNFMTKICPKGFCAYPSSNHFEILLPSTTSVIEISSFVCQENRTGILCGNCTPNHSVFYHTEQYYCFPDKLCYLGWLFYILAELLPLTFFFGLVIGLDIKFNSGYLNGLLFYMQIFDSLYISASNMVWFPSHVHGLLKTLRVIYRMFNLSFFSIKQLSFCLWKGANTLDMIAFNYVTVLYSLLLLLLTVGVVKWCSTSQKRSRRFNVDKSKFSKSIIHGLSSLLVLCYSQCTKVSLLLLTPAFFHGGNRVLYHGGFKYLEGPHLRYALPAFCLLVVITILPPVLLLSYPLCYRVLAFFRIQESKFSRVLCKVIPLEKYKPFFDSFQGTFRDECRYFAGLYFLYRFLILLSFALSVNLLSFYVLNEILFVLMLSLHTWVGPYKNKWHNRLDIFIFALLAVINGITLYNHVEKLEENTALIVDVTSSIQVMLAYLPLVYILSFTLYKGTLKVNSF